MSSYKRKSSASGRPGAAKKQRRTSRPAQRSVVNRYVSSYPSRSASAGAELKGVDTSFALVPILATTNTNASMFTLNLVVPGNGSFNRVGRKIRMKSARIRGNMEFYIASSATTLNMEGNTVRVVLVYDKQPSGVLPTFDTIFGHTLPDGTEATNFLDGLKYDNTARFKVLKDWVKSASASVIPTGGTENFGIYKCEIDEFVKLNALETVYSGQSSPQTIADISSGALYLIMRVDTNNATTLVGADSNSFVRLRYYD